MFLRGNFGHKNNEKHQNNGTAYGKKETKTKH